MLKVAHIREEEIQGVAPKRLPLYKDPVFMAQLAKDFIRDHNAKFDRKQAKQAKH